MISDWHSFKAYLAADFRSRGDSRILKSLVFDPVARFTALLRLNEYLLNTGKPLLVRAPVLLWFRLLSVRLGFSVGPNIFGPGLAIVHYGLLVIDPTTRIGKNCRIHMGVHIGGDGTYCAPEDAHKYSPRIGDNVYIGPGAKLYGPIVIGNEAVIGANAVVTRSFPEHGLVLAGVPAKVIGQGSVGERVIQGAA
jgi:serine O-acetyltransferase